MAAQGGERMTPDWPHQEGRPGHIPDPDPDPDPDPETKTKLRIEKIINKDDIQFSTTLKPQNFG